MESAIRGSGQDDDGGQDQGVDLPERTGEVEALLGVIPDAVIVGDVTTGRVVSWNPAAAALFGYPLEAGPGLQIADLVAPRHRADHQGG